MRSEHDSLGTMELPSDCLYGIRTARCLANTSFSGTKLRDYPELIKSIALVKQACAHANSAAQIVPPELSELIVEAARGIASGLHHDAFVVDMLHGGGYIGFNINANEVIANLCNLQTGGSPGTGSPVDPAVHVNACQSTADVCHTAARLALLDTGAHLLTELGKFERAIDNKRKELADIRTVARTCLQDAMPSSLGETVFGPMVSFIHRRAEAYKKALAELNQVNLGGTVIGSGGGADETYRRIVLEHLIEVTGRSSLKLRPNLFDAAQNIDDLRSLSSSMTTLAEGLIKFAKDLRLLSSGPHCGFGELALPAVQEGSSFFKGKINPVVPETLIQACMQIIGFDRAVQSAFEHAELSLNVFEGIALKNLLDMQRYLRSALELFRDRCISGITANLEVCQKFVSSVPEPIAPGPPSIKTIPRS